jgi:hypothetical protein
MIVKCIDNNLCSTLTIGKEYLVLEEAVEYYVILDDTREEITSRKTRFVVVEDGDISKKTRATITELTYQLENNNSDIKQFNIRKNSKGDIKEIIIKFKYE